MRHGIFTALLLLLACPAGRCVAQKIVEPPLPGVTPDLPPEVLPGALPDAVPPLPDMPPLPVDGPLPERPPPAPDAPLPDAPLPDAPLPDGVPALPDIPLPDMPPLPPDAPVDGAPPIAPGGEVVKRIRVLPPGPGESTLAGKFTVFGGTLQERNAIISISNELRKRVYSVLRRPDQDGQLIVIQLRDAVAMKPGGGQIWSRILTTDAGYRIELNAVLMGGTVSGPLLRRELVRCLLAGLMLQNHKTADLSDRDAPPPDWLLYGMQEVLDYFDSGRLSDEFATVFKLGHVLSTEDIFAADPDKMDSVSLAIYRTSCCGLLLMLLENPGVESRFTALMHELVLDGENPSAAIARAYPGLNTSGNSLAKWWTLQLAAMSRPGLDELLTPLESGKRLAAALVLEIPATTTPAAAEKKPGPKEGLRKLFKRNKEEAKAAAAPQTAATTAPGRTAQLAEYQTLLSHPARESIFRQADLALMELGFRAHPIYRPLIQDYRELVLALAENRKTKDADKTLARLESTRQRLSGEMQQIEDYMDWFEATQTASQSGEFDACLEAIREMEAPRRPRGDAVSRYLDEVELEYRE